MGLFNVFDLQAKLGLDKDGFDRGLQAAETGAEKFAYGLGRTIRGAAIAIGAGITAATGAIVSVTKQAVESYAEYEQLVGGVETLFKDAADTVKQDAAEAFEFAGISANEYMQTVTSFSASLMQSLGNDTAKTAAYSKKALKDMSDNANKMGSDMASIQRAYQGFAKQNYMMLDNLKLGYGGTKTEMERLIMDAEKLDDTFHATRLSNGDLAMSYADIIDAIHIVQTEMGITGTTALEASTTISGSLSAAKAAYANLITGIADENADFDTLVGNFVDTVGTAAENIIPRIEIALQGAGEVIERLAPVISQALPGLIENVLPNVARAGVTLFVALVQNISEIAQGIANELPTLIDEIKTALLGENNIEKIASAGVDLLVSLIENLPEILDGIIEGLKQVVTGIVKWFESPENQEKMREVGQHLLLWIADGFLNDNPVAEWLAKLSGHGGLYDQLKQLYGEAGLLAGENMADGVREGFTTRMDENGEIIISHSRPKNIIGEGELFRDWSAVGEEMANGLKTGYIDRSDKDRPEMVYQVLELVDDVEDELGINSPSKVFRRIGEFMADGLKVGFEGKIPNIINIVKQRVRDIVHTVRDEMQIKSPSKVFAKIGKYMAEGLGEGWQKGIEDIKPIITDAIPTELNGGGNAGGTKITQNIYAEKMTPSQAFQAALDAQETAAFLGFAPAYQEA